MITGGFTGEGASYTLSLRCACGKAQKFVDVNYTSAASAARAAKWILRLSSCACPACAKK